MQVSPPDHVHVNHKEFIVTSSPDSISSADPRRLFDGNTHHYWNNKWGNAGFKTRRPASGSGVTLVVDTLKERHLR